MTDSQQQRGATPPTNHQSPITNHHFKWVPFFAVLACLATVAVVLPIAYNMNQQLRPEQLAEARARWTEHGPRDYDLEYTLSIDRDPQPYRYLVLVRGGRVVLATRDGEVVKLDPRFGFLMGTWVRTVESDDQALSVDGIFDRIEQILTNDPNAGHRNLTVAVFDPKDGHPRRFVYRVKGTSQRQEWVLRLSPPQKP